MDTNYSQEEIQAMMVRKHQTLLLTAFDYDDITQKYKLKTQELLDGSI